MRLLQHRERLWGRLLRFQQLRIEPLHPHADPVRHATVHQGLDQRLVGILQPGVLADDRDVDLAGRQPDRIDHPVPAIEVGGRFAREFEIAEHLRIEPLPAVDRRHLVHRVSVDGRHHAVGVHVAEQRELGPLRFGNRPVAAAQQQVRLDPDAAQFLHGMLGRLGLLLTHRLQVRHEREMQVQHPGPTHLVAELADRLEERQAFDVTDRAADLDQHEVLIVGVGADEFLDRVRHMGNDLDGTAQVIAAPLAGQHPLVDAARRHVVAAVRLDTRKALVVAQIEVGLGAVVGDIDLAMLVRAHRPGIDVQVRIEFPQAHPVAVRLQQCAQSGRGEAFAEGRHDAARNEQETRRASDITPGRGWRGAERGCRRPRRSSLSSRRRRLGV